MIFMTELSETVTDLVLRPVDGYVTTVNGHCIPQPPWIVHDDPNTVIAYDQWLIDQGRREAQELGDDWMIRRLADAVAEKMEAPTRHLLSDFLFGQPQPKFEARS
jgi:hypothetical protein